MTKSKLFTGLAFAGMLLSTSALSPIGPMAVAPAQAQSVSVSFNLFFDELEPHGVWVRHPQYRYVFCPTGVDTNWRPYTRGRWLYLADHGWYFASDEPFAWATYHYGRWLDDENLGWCWVPGTKWAPAWVSWRRGGDVVGWAPLPPEGEGFAVSLEIGPQDVPEAYWVFVPTQSFVEPNLSVDIIFGSDADTYYQQTEYLGPVVVEGDVVTNNVLEVTYIEQQINQEITVYNVEQASDPEAVAVTGDQTVQIFSQDVEEPTEEAAPAKAVEEAEASAVIAEEGGTAGAEQSGDAPSEITVDDEATETEVQTNTQVDATGAPAETAEPEAEATEPAATEAETADPEAATTGAEQQEPAATTQEQPDAEQQTTIEDETTETEPATVEEQTEQAAPAAEETEQAAQPEASQDESAAPADADAEQTEEAAPAEKEAAPAEEEAVAPECPAEQVLVDGVCQPTDARQPEAAPEETAAPEASAEESGDAAADAEAGGGAETTTAQ